MEQLASDAQSPVLDAARSGYLESRPEVWTSLGSDGARILDAALQTVAELRDRQPPAAPYLLLLLAEDELTFWDRDFEVPCTTLEEVLETIAEVYEKPLFELISELELKPVDVQEHFDELDVLPEGTDPERVLFVLQSGDEQPFLSAAVVLSED